MKSQQKPNCLSFLSWITVVVSFMFTGFATDSVGQDLFGIERSGNLVSIDKGTGDITLIGNSGVFANSLASDSQGRLFTVQGLSFGIRNLVNIDPATGAGSFFFKSSEY